MWHGRVDARPSIRPTKACGHMRDDWHGAVAIPMSASCASSTAAYAAPLSFVYFSEVAGSRSIVPWALGRVIELHARRTARLTHAQHHVPRCGRETPSARLHSNTAHTHTQTQQQQQQQELMFFKPRLASKHKVVLVFLFYVFHYCFWQLAQS